MTHLSTDRFTLDLNKHPSATSLGSAECAGVAPRHKADYVRINNDISLYFERNLCKQSKKYYVVAIMFYSVINSGIHLYLSNQKVFVSYVEPNNLSPVPNTLQFQSFNINYDGCLGIKKLTWIL